MRPVSRCSFLEKNRDAELQEMAHHLQAVRRVAGEAAQRLRDDAVDEPVLAVLQEPLERRPRLLPRAADALVAVDAREHPALALPDVLLEVFALRLQAFLLLRQRRRDAAVRSHALLQAYRLVSGFDFLDRLHILTPVSVIRSMSLPARNSKSKIIKFSEFRRKDFDILCHDRPILLARNQPRLQQAPCHGLRPKELPLPLQLCFRHTRLRRCGWSPSEIRLADEDMLLFVCHEKSPPT